jgi:hypothetical protein
MPRRSLVVSNASSSWGSPTVSVAVTKPSAGAGMFSASPTAYAGAAGYVGFLRVSIATSSSFYGNYCKRRYSCGWHTELPAVL